MLKRCECGARVREKFMRLHIERECPKKRMAKKREYYQKHEQSLDERLDILDKYPGIDFPSNLETMSDNGFNDFIGKHEDKLKRELEEKKAKLIKLQAKAAEIELAEIKKQEQEEADKLRREKEEVERLNQYEVEQIKFLEKQEEREAQEKVFAEQRKVEKIDNDFSEEELEKLEKELNANNNKSNS